LKAIKSNGLKGFPRLLMNGYYAPRNSNYIALTKFDLDLDIVYNRRQKRFLPDTIINIGIQMVDRLEKFH